jgi:ankyrin repeat protein
MKRPFHQFASILFSVQQEVKPFEIRLWWPIDLPFNRTKSFHISLRGFYQIFLAETLQPCHKKTCTTTKSFKKVVENIMDLRDALFDAVVKGDEATVCHILNIGGNLAINDSDGYTALHWSAASPEGEKLVPLLVSKKANINVRDNFGQTPLHVHCSRGCIYGVACLLHHGADPNCRTTDTNQSALDLAEHHNQDEIIKLLLTYGASQNSAGTIISPLVKH